MVDKKDKDIKATGREQPEIYSVQKGKKGLELNRRSFLRSTATAGLLAAFARPINSHAASSNCGRAHSANVMSVAISPDSTLLASASDDHTIKIWSLPDGKLLKTLEGHSFAVNSVVMSPNNTLLASNQYKKIKLWSLPDGNLLKTLEGHSSGVRSVAISPDSTLLASACDDNIKLWSLPDGKLLGCVFDLAVTEKGTEMTEYKQMGHKTFTQPCGNPIPAHATCICNCIGGSLTYQEQKTVCTCDTISVPAGHPIPAGTTCTCDTIAVGSFKTIPKGHKRNMTGTTCSCDTICTCNTISTGYGGHYWRPN